MATSDVFVRFGADASEMLDALRQAGVAMLTAQETIQKLGTAAGTSAAPIGQATAATAKMADTSASVETAMQRQINALTGVGRESKSASESAGAFGAVLKDQKETADQAKDAHEGLGGALGRNRNAMMEAGHSARAFADGLAAGMDPTRLLVMELPRMAQALAGVSPTALAAAAGVVALGAQLFKTTAEAYQFHQAMIQLRDISTLTDKSGGAGTEKTTTQMRLLAKEAGLQASEVANLQVQWAALPKALQGSEEDFVKLSATLASFRHTDAATEGAQLAKAWAGGADGVTRYLEAIDHLSDQERAALQEAKARNDATAAQAVLLSSLKRLQDEYTESVRKTEQQRQQDEEAAIAQSSGFDGAMTMAPVREAPVPQRDRHEASPEQQAAMATAREQAAAEQQIADLKTKQQQLSEQINKDERDGTAEAQARLQVERQALAEVNLRLQQAHTPVDQDAHAVRMAHLQQEMAAADQDYERRVEIASKIASETAKYDGEGSAAAIQAQTQLTSAVRQLTQEQLREKIDALRQQQAIYAENPAKVLEVEDQIISIMRASGAASRQELNAAQTERIGMVRRAAQSGLDAEISALQLKLQENIKNAAQRDQIMADLNAKLRERYKDDSAALDNALRENLAKVQQYSREAIRGYEEEAKQAARAEQEKTKDVSEAIEYKRAAGTITLAQSVQDRLAEIAAEKRLTQQIIEEYRQRALAAATSAEERAAVEKRFDALSADSNRNFAREATQIQRQAVQEQTRQYQQLAHTITRSMGQAFTGIVTGSETGRQAAQKMAVEAINTMVGAAEKQAEAWIEKNVIMLASDETTNEASQAASAANALTQITDASAVGAANAYASASAGPEWWVAPAVSAAVMLAISGLTSSIASAEGGWGEVPYDGAPTVLHKKEMVLPASIATPLREMVSQGTSPFAGLKSIAGAIAVPDLQMPTIQVPQFRLPSLGSSMMAAPAGGGGGGGAAASSEVHHHTHNWDVKAMDMKSFEGVIKSGGGDVIHKFLRNKSRNFGM